jgi:SAM-dependent methyltransferase
MSLAFPLEQLSLVRCPADGGDLSAPPALRAAGSVSDGAVRCSRCSEEYRVREGVLDLLGADAPIAPESSRELAARDREAAESRGGPRYQEGWLDELESRATLRRMGPVEGRRVLEVGAGSGFYTRRLAALGVRGVAVDFSMEALRINGRHLPPGAAVGLVRADVTRFAPAPGAFDLSLNTAYSNLPTAELRRAANLAVHRALRPGGTYLVSAHHHDLRRRLRREPPSGRYAGSGIFFQRFTRISLRSELAPLFPEVSVATAGAWVPLLSGFARLRGALSRLCEAVPGLDTLGCFLLATARGGPRAAPDAGVDPSGLPGRR